jgi:hypothetical protein
MVSSTVWSGENSNISDEVISEYREEDLLEEDVKSAKKNLNKKIGMGLLDVPTGIGEFGDEDTFEVANFRGTKQNPGLARELGDDEEADFYGATGNFDELPPANKKNGEGKMKTEIAKLEAYLKYAGKEKQALRLAELVKLAITAGNTTPPSSSDKVNKPSKHIEYGDIPRGIFSFLEKNNQIYTFGYDIYIVDSKVYSDNRGPSFMSGGLHIPSSTNDFGELLNLLDLTQEEKNSLLGRGATSDAQQDELYPVLTNNNIVYWVKRKDIGTGKTILTDNFVPSNGTRIYNKSQILLVIINDANPEVYDRPDVGSSFTKVVGEDAAFEANLLLEEYKIHPPDVGTQGVIDAIQKVISYYRSQPSSPATDTQQNSSPPMGGRTQTSGGGAAPAVSGPIQRAAAGYIFINGDETYAYKPNDPNGTTFTAYRRSDGSIANQNITREQMETAGAGLAVPGQTPPSPVPSPSVPPSPSGGTTQSDETTPGPITIPGVPGVTFSYIYNTTTECFVVKTTDSDIYPKGKEYCKNSTEAAVKTVYDYLLTEAYGSGHPDPSRQTAPASAPPAETPPGGVSGGAARPEDTTTAPNQVLIPEEGMKEKFDEILAYYNSKDSNTAQQETTKVFEAWKTGTNTIIKDEKDGPDGRKIGIMDLDKDGSFGLPMDLRYDGAYFDTSQNAWVAGRLSKKEIRALQSGPLAAELRRERRRGRRILPPNEGRSRKRIRRRESRRNEAAATATSTSTATDHLSDRRTARRNLVALIHKKAHR